MTILKNRVILNVGWWNDYSNNYPSYKLPPKPNTANYDVSQVVNYLKSCRRTAHTWGFSSCRICGQSAGTTGATDGIISFPAGLIHYVDVHKIKLPDYIIEHIGDKEVAEEPNLEDLVSMERGQPNTWVDWINANGVDLEEDIDKYLAVASEEDKQRYDRMLNRKYPYVHRKSRPGLTEEEAIEQGLGVTLEMSKPRYDARFKHKYGPLLHYGISEPMGELIY